MTTSGRRDGRSIASSFLSAGSALLIGQAVGAAVGAIEVRNFVVPDFSWQPVAWFAACGIVLGVALTASWTRWRGRLLPAGLLFLLSVCSVAASFWLAPW